MGKVMGGGGKPPDGTQSLSSVMTAYAVSPETAVMMGTRGD